MYFVYIIYSITHDRYYIGQTEDIARRLLQHQQGKNFSTKFADDWELKYSESFNTRTEAIIRERQIKKKKSRKYIEWLVNGN